jgi:hypothetical protein
MRARWDTSTSHALAGIGKRAREIIMSDTINGYETKHADGQTSRRGKQYLETARTLLRAAQTVTDRAIELRLRALVEDFQRRAEKASRDDSAKLMARSAVRPNEFGGANF